MSSAECLRDLICERLTAAAEEIFTVVQKTIIEYQKEIDRQHRLLDIVWTPGAELHRTKLLQQHVCKETERLTDQQLCNQERNSNLHQDAQTEHPQIKEEQEELCTSLEGEQLALKQEAETVILTPNCVESDNSEEQNLGFSPDETQSAEEEEHVVSMSVQSSAEPDPKREYQLLSHRSHDPKGGKQGDAGSGDAEPTPQKRHHKSKTYTNTDNTSTTSKTHSDTDTGKQCFKCDTCGKYFMYKSKLHRHLRIHTGEKPYPCNHCEKRFSELGALKVHMRVHTGEKPYSCDFCETRFSHLSALKKHIRVHTGEKPYPCNTCDHRFSQLGALKEHMRVHTGEKPYPCSICKKCFSQLCTLKVHMKIHTDEKPYNCKICGKEFRRRYHLKIHMKTHGVTKDSFRYQT